MAGCRHTLDAGITQHQLCTITEKNIKLRTIGSEVLSLIKDRGKGLLNTFDLLSNNNTRPGFFAYVGGRCQVVRVCMCFQYQLQVQSAGCDVIENTVNKARICLA